jgi:hypothetical protein
VLDTVTAEIMIRKSLKEKEERVSVNCFRVLEVRNKALDQRINESEKSDLPKYKREILEVDYGCRFPERETEEHFRVLRVEERRTILLTWSFRPVGCGGWCASIFVKRSGPTSVRSVGFSQLTSVLHFIP